MKLHNNHGRKDFFFWKLAFSFSFLFSVSQSKAACPSVCYMNLTLLWRKWAISEVYNPALLEEKHLSKKIAGLLVEPEGEGKDACRPGTNFTIPPNTEDWIAFIARGGCTLKEKIKAALGKGATGVLIYGRSCPDRRSLILIHGETGDMAAIMISSQKVKQILRLIQAGIRVTAVIEVGTTPCFWKIYLCAHSLILTFVAYVLLFCTPSEIVVGQEEQSTQPTEAELQKAVCSLKSHRLKKDEFDLAEETCVVCLETFKPREVVRILTCRHIFHKRCIDRWLLKRGSCPIC
ncbi:E3 ubiquitin-protein ligase RNF133-like, partial [Sceloporus undulatus]|uniref:E3 ubiquitin-protein ligase RNF133-like n=1 Tax=Sceloporus undulatus TaxID=8520 RepID=UPI001C4BD12F